MLCTSHGNFGCVYFIRGNLSSSQCSSTEILNYLIQALKIEQWVYNKTC